MKEKRDRLDEFLDLSESYPSLPRMGKIVYMVIVVSVVVGVGETISWLFGLSIIKSIWLSLPVIYLCYVWAYYARRHRWP